MHNRLQSPLPARCLLAAAVVLWAGCKTSTYVLQVDAINQTGQVAQQTAEPKSYRIRSHNPNVADDSLRYNEVSAYIKTALSGKGLYEAPSAENADLIIEIDYGMESPRMKYQTVIKPIIVLTTSQPKPLPDRSPNGGQNLHADQQRRWSADRQDRRLAGGSRAGGGVRKIPKGFGAGEP